MRTRRSAFRFRLATYTLAESATLFLSSASPDPLKIVQLADEAETDLALLGLVDPEVAATRWSAWEGEGPHPTISVLLSVLGFNRISPWLDSQSGY
jgi:hypothetical protein